MCGDGAELVDFPLLTVAHVCPSQQEVKLSLRGSTGASSLQFFDVDGVTGVVVTESPPIEEESAIIFIGKPIARSKTPRGLPKSKISLLA